MSHFPSPEQQRVLQVQDKNILVSAQAGAGKTAVLVERIIDKVARERVGLDHMLIVTFTRKAALEMKSRIMQRLTELAAEEPENRAWLSRQLTLLPSAPIETLHAFLFDYLQYHFDQLGLDAGFTILEGRKLQQIQEEAMDELLTAVYSRTYSEDPELSDQLLDFTFRYGLSSRRNDRELRRLILDMNESLQLQLRPEEWLEGCLSQLQSEAGDQALKEAYLHDLLFPLVLDIVRLLQKMEDRCQADNRLDKVVDFLGEERARLLSALFSSADSPAEESYRQLLQSDDPLAWLSEKEESFLPLWEERGLELHFERFPFVSRKKATEAEIGWKEEVKGLRDKVKSLWGSLTEGWEKLEGKQWVEDNRRMGEDLALLAQLTHSYQQRLWEKKKKARGVQFDDLERMMIACLDQEEIRQDLRRQYRYIFFDEYQDASEIQNYIVSRMAGENNLFFVGDIKQSIYGFRRAEPQNFIDRYRDYQKEEGSTALDLTTNFRAGGRLLELVNYLFEELMTPERTGINYRSKTHRSRPAEGKEEKGEAWLVFLSEEDEGADSGLPPYLREISSQAFFCAGKIQEHVAAGGHYSDCAILFRTRSAISSYERVLNYYGIPSYAEGRQGEPAMEVQLAIQLFRLVDNGEDDIALLSTLSSCVGNFSDDELASIRLAHPEGAYWEAFHSYLGEGGKENPSLQAKALAFDQKIQGYRRLFSRQPFSQFIQQLLQESGLYSFSSSLAGGKKRRERLDSLVRLAHGYESKGGFGLYSFLLYLQSQEASGGEEEPAVSLAEGDERVRLMTIHQSKGLEFPLVFMVELERKFYSRLPVLSVDTEGRGGLGMALRRVEDDPEMGRVEGESLRQELIQRKAEVRDKAEEARVLYVGMTRAEEKLFLLSGGKKMEDWQEQNAALPLSSRLDQASSYAEWLAQIIREKPGLPAGLINESGEAYRKKAEKGEGIPSEEVPSSVDAGSILSFCYPYQEDSQTPIKMTVSELSKKNENLDEHYKPWPKYEEENHLSPVKEKLLSWDDRPLPSFMQEKESFSPAERGSLMHLALQALELKNYDRESLEEALDQLEGRRLFSPAEREALDVEGLLAFFRSPEGQLMVSRSEQVRREQSFTMVVEEGGRRLAVDGQIDLFLEDEEGIFLLDFKTDRNPQADRYDRQLQFYGEALSRACHKPVKKAWLFWIARGYSTEVDMSVLPFNKPGRHLD